MKIMNEETFFYKIFEKHELIDRKVLFNEEAIDKIQDAKNTKTLLKIWDDVCGNYFLNYDVDINLKSDEVKKLENFIADLLTD